MSYEEYKAYMDKATVSMRDCLGFLKDSPYDQQRWKDYLGQKKLSEADPIPYRVWDEFVATPN